jgi:predicted nucleic acid-binding protein
MIEFLIDNNVLSQILKGNVDAAQFVFNLDTIAIDTTIYVEALQGQKGNQEKFRIRKFLTKIPLIHFTPDISKKTIALIDSYSNSHNLMLPDAQIAACCLKYDLTLVTYNLKDFKFIKGLKILTLPFPQM